MPDYEAIKDRLAGETRQRAAEEALRNQDGLTQPELFRELWDLGREYGREEYEHAEEHSGRTGGCHWCAAERYALADEGKDRLTLEAAGQHVGDRVIYATVPGEAETGVIDSVGSKFVYVRYDKNGRRSVPKPTYPENLILMRGGSFDEHMTLSLRDARIPGLDLPPETGARP